jgi:phage/plasmid-associated DNA primase
VIKIDESIPKAERDPTLPRKLREPETLEAILAWAVRGAIAWHKRHKKGLPMLVPEAVEEEVSKYERESDHVNLFAEEALQATSDPNDRVPKADVFKHYLKWCEAVGRDTRETSYGLSPKLRDLGFEEKMARANGKAQRCWLGIELKDIASSGIKVKGATTKRAGRKKK